MEQNDEDNMKPNHLDRKSAEGSRLSLEALYKIAPSCFTETRDAHTGELRHKIDFDALRQLLGDDVACDVDEMYQFTWPGKREARREAARATDKTLRPAPADSADWDTTRNLYIEGDNLEALKLLQRSYMGKVKMIYIDPPYNTGGDFVYRDDFATSAADYEAAKGNVDEQGLRYRRNTDSNGRFHSDWCSMIYARLLVARTLLTEDGVIFISIDDNEVENLKKICNEVFGEQNFVATMVWQSTAGSNTGTDIVTVTENILVFTKNRSCFQFDGQLSNEDSFQYSDEYEPTRGKFSLDKMDRRRVGSHYSPSLNYAIEMPDGTSRFPGGSTEKAEQGWNYLWSATKVKWGMENGFIVFKKGDNGEWNVYNKRYSKVDNEGKPCERSTPFRNLILSNQFNTAQGTSELRSLFENRPFDFPKPSALIRHLLLTTVRSNKDAIILDFFSGSATTAHAVMQLNAEDGGNRKFIMVQLPEETAEDSEARKAGYKNICEIGKERIRRAGAKLKAEMQKEKSKGGDLFDTKTQQLTTNNRATNNSTLDTGFRVLRLSESNFTDVSKSPAEYDQQTLDLFADNIRADRTDLDLLFGCMTAWGIDLSLPMAATEVDRRTIYTVDEADSRIGTDQSGLVACFAPDVTLPVVRAIAAKRPQRIVFRDSCFREDKQKINIFEQFKQLLDWSDEEARNNIRVI